MAKQTTTTAPNVEKYAINANLPNSSRRSSNERVGSVTIPKSAMNTAPTAMRIVPRTSRSENTSPRRNLAKKAFHSKDTAPRGASMTTGREAIWTKDPRIFDKKNITRPEMSGPGLDDVEYTTTHRNPKATTFAMIKSRPTD
jgi:hypothetical protein